ncbi:uncharacterized protein B0I36DRAFT_114777 [Microdochium trichocladiopsis]|uniref:Uncharacterized protein n=1 Tax=Microdochium trichocladiopsis TaxID=1682393 RepID=A0A9P9BQG5_9PEZI|nr:uncharacterized protein B0I36DRAFT_114777 [Microdochium trichocladiopsis]KAH7030845.1 hypothetical protein B0I36DRAFT_114777 [Microdochium trichocladiopsis]
MPEQPCVLGMATSSVLPAVVQRVRTRRVAARAVVGWLREWMPREKGCRRQRGARQRVLVVVVVVVGLEWREQVRGGRPTTARARVVVARQEGGGGGHWLAGDQARLDSALLRLTGRAGQQALVPGVACHLNSRRARLSRHSGGDQGWIACPLRFTSQGRQALSSGRC